MKALTGVTLEEFELLIPEFDRIQLEHATSIKRKRAVGGGRKGILKNSTHKLFFILFYLKVYPTYDLAASIFDVDRSRVCRWVQIFLPILETVLGRSCALPKRQINSMEEFLTCFKGVGDIFFDGVERPTQRSKNHEKQRKHYSGKKKRHTRKNIVGTDEYKRVHYLSPTKGGKIHDFKQVKKTGILNHIPPDVSVWVDKGFAGIKDIVDEDQVMIPHKKPKGSELTDDQKTENKIISGIRITVEHAISGIKRFGCATNILRNRKGQDDQMMAICAGLWNFHLQNA